MTKLIIVRHGQTNFNKEKKLMGHTDFGLNEIGRTQAEAVAKKLSVETIHAIYSSPLKRALETAHAINKYHKKKVIIENNLREINLGNAEGKTREEIEKIVPGFNFSNDNHRKKFNIELFSETVEMLHKNFIPKLMELSSHHSVVLVSHGLKIRSLFSALKMPIANDLKIPNTAITIVELEKNNTKILLHNDASHLQAI